MDTLSVAMGNQHVTVTWQHGTDSAHTPREGERLVCFPTISTPWENLGIIKDDAMLTGIDSVSFPCHCLSRSETQMPRVRPRYQGRIQGLMPAESRS